MIDPRKAKTLGEACDNGNGTYNGFRALAFMSEALYPGHGMSEEKVKELWDAECLKRKGNASVVADPGARDSATARTATTRPMPDIGKA